jgi:HSP20 family protein
MSLLKHKDPIVEPDDEFPMAALPSWRWFDDLLKDADGRHMIMVEEYQENGTLVVKAELPGIDPDNDVYINVENGTLHINAQRRGEEETPGRDFHHRELRYGSFARSIALPDGVGADGVTASYKDGLLEVRVMLPAEDAPIEGGSIKVTRG